MPKPVIPPPVPSSLKDVAGSNPLTNSVPFAAADIHHPETTPKNGRTKLIALIVTIIGMTAAAVVWAAREHDGIKDWTAERDYATKNEVVEIVEKHYVPTEDFVEVRTKQEYIQKKVDDIDEKVDEMHMLLIGGERPKGYESRND